MAPKLFIRNDESQTFSSRLEDIADEELVIPEDNRIDFSLPVMEPFIMDN